MKSQSIIYAPMAGFSDSPTRRIAKSYGADLVISGLISAEAVIRESRRSRDLARFDNSERPIGIQIFGANPESMARAARELADLAPDFIDINFGCPVRKVVEKNGGSSVLKDLPLLEQIARAVIAAVDIPVTVKIRAGWDLNSLVFLEAGRIIEDTGAVAITLHPRTKVQGFSGHADWNLIAQLKETVTIPVIGNGDIFSPQDARSMLDETGCDAVMIGRAALGYPWIFEQIRRYLDHGELIPSPTPVERIDQALEHFQTMIDFYGLPHAVYRMRAHFCYYLKGIPGAAPVKAEINRQLLPSRITELLQEFRDSLAGNPSRDSMDLAS